MSESILEKALLEAEQLEETMKSNAKEILSSTMKEEIHELVKESLSEDDYLREQEEEEEVDVIDIEDDMDGDEPEIDLDMSDDMELGIEDETEDEEVTMELPPLDLTLASDTEVLKVFKAMGDEDGIIIQQDGNEIDLTDNTTDTEYIIKLDESKKSKTMKKSIKENEYMDEMEDMDNMEEMEDMDEMDELEIEDGVVYEIELSEDDMDDEVEEGKDEELEEHQGYNDRMDDSLGSLHPNLSKGNSKQSFSSRRHEREGMDKYLGNTPDNLHASEEEIGEASRTLGFGRESNGKHKPSGIRKAITNNRNLGESRIRKSYNLLKEEVETLKVKNSDYKKALTTFKDKLNEVGVFNSNLAYVTRLFTEHSTTKTEKINILKRFDGVNSLKSSKGLYKVIREELSRDVVNPTKTIAESVEQKITKSPTSGGGGKLLESKVYENPQFSRMKDLMSKL